MLDNGVMGIGLSARKRANDLSDFGAELDELQSYGVQSVELPTFDMDIVVGTQVRPAQLAALKRACAGRGLIYSVHGPLAINLMDEDWRLPRHMEVLAASLDVAAELGAVHYVLHNGIASQQQAAGRQAAQDRQRARLTRAAELAAERGTVLCVETMFAGHVGRAVTQAPSQLAADLAAIDHPNLRATLDFSHAYLKLSYDGRRDDYLNEMKAIAPWARHLHLHDSFGLADDVHMHSAGERVAFGHGDLHLPLGWGDIPWLRIFDECVFPEGVLFNLEMKDRFWYAVPEAVAQAQGFAARARTAQARPALAGARLAASTSS